MGNDVPSILESLFFQESSNNAYYDRRTVLDDKLQLSDMDNSELLKYNARSTKILQSIAMDSTARH